MVLDTRHQCRARWAVSTEPKPVNGQNDQHQPKVYRMSVTSGSIARVSYYNQQKDKMPKRATHERWKSWYNPVSRSIDPGRKGVSARIWVRYSPNWLSGRVLGMIEPALKSQNPSPTPTPTKPLWSTSAWPEHLKRSGCSEQKQLENEKTSHRVGGHIFKSYIW